jgi:hypothetical protein
MANIKSHDGQAHMSATYSKPEETASLTTDGKTHLTLTVTTDGRLLRKTAHRFRSSQRKCGYRLSSTDYRLVTKVRVHPSRLTEEYRPQLRADLAAIAARWGYAPDHTEA